jgi:hypothetical protein
MAWRIDESVIRGEIDNREKGIVRGRLWLVHRNEPVILELKGNCCPDLAGCLLKFENPEQPIKHPNLDGFFCEQRGAVGDMTASRKVREYDIPFEQAYALIEKGEKPPEHTANSIYLEWFSEKNGRVVVESPEYKVEISAPEWRLTKEEEQQSRREVEASWKKFTEQLNQAVEAQRHKHPEEIEEWDEFDFEKSLRESDAITDKYLELLDKYGDTPESEKIINKEMGWDEDAEGFEDEDDENRMIHPVENAGVELDGDEIDESEPDPTTEGIDWIRIKDELGEDIRHPLQHRCHEAAMWIWKKSDELGLAQSNDDDLAQLIAEYQITGAKLAGALNGLAYGRDTHEPGFVVACLKRALDHLHKAQAGLEKVSPKKLLPDSVLSKARTDLFEIREEILRLMNEFRKAK